MSDTVATSDSIQLMMQRQEIGRFNHTIERLTTDLIIAESNFAASVDRHLKDVEIIERLTTELENVQCANDFCGRTIERLTADRDQQKASAQSTARTNKILRKKIETMTAACDQT